MLPSIYRLKNKKDFAKVWQQGKNFREEYLVLKVVDNEKEVSRIGLVVSKKDFPKATIRNRIKRQLRASLALFLPELVPAKDIIIIFLKKDSLPKSEELRENLKKLFRKAGLLANVY